MLSFFYNFIDILQIVLWLWTSFSFYGIQIFLSFLIRKNILFIHLIPFHTKDEQTCNKKKSLFESRGIRFEKKLVTRKKHATHNNNNNNNNNNNSHFILFVKFFIIINR